MFKPRLKATEDPRVEMSMFLGRKSTGRKGRFAYVHWKLLFKYRLRILKLFVLVCHPPSKKKSRKNLAKT